MAEKKTGKIIHRQVLSEHLAVFRVMPEEGSPFPEYTAGQHMALSRDNCKLTKKLVDAHGGVKYEYDTDASGKQKRGTVVHDYSISSAPHETLEEFYLEFYIAFEMIDRGVKGRFSESVFNTDSESDDTISYMNKVAGEFTLDKSAAGFENVIMVGTGTGLAPFASMMKQVHYDTVRGRGNGTRYTLFHTNRRLEELGYHHDFLAIQSAKKVDFVYVPSVSRPAQKEYDNATLGKGRANNIVRHIFNMPMKEEQDVETAESQGDQTSRLKQLFQKSTRPMLPKHVTTKQLIGRMDPSRSVILTCGNPNVMDDIRYIAEMNKIKFVKEEW